MVERTVLYVRAPDYFVMPMIFGYLLLFDEKNYDKIKKSHKR